MNRQDIFYGWYVTVALSIIGMIASSVRYSFPVFAPSFLMEFGWTRTTIGFAFTLHCWISCLLSPLIGMILDKFGGRLVLFIGSVILLGSTVLFSTITSIWQLHIYYGVIAGIGLGCTYLAPISSIARKWFIRKAGTALSIVLTGSGIGLAVGPPIISFLIGKFGWREAYAIFGIPVSLICMLMAVFVIRNDPESMNLLPDGQKNVNTQNLTGECLNEQSSPIVREKDWKLRHALKTANFWLINLAYGLGLLGIIAIITHMVSWAQDLRVDMKSAAFALFLLGICSVLSRIAGGVLCDRFGAKIPLYVGTLALAIINVYALQVHDKTSLYIFAVLTGLFYGLQFPSWAPLLGNLFGRKSIGTLMGFLTFAFGCITAPGPTIFGWIFDRYGSYNAAFLLTSVCFLVTFLLVLLIKPHREEVGSDTVIKVKPQTPLF